ncbi:MAG: phage portal protein, partial [Pseudomonadota bacterium]
MGKLGQYCLSVLSAVAGKSAASNFATAMGIEGGTSGATKMAQPFAQSVWVMRAIKHVAGPIAGVPMELRVLGADGDGTEVQDPRVKAFWKKPFMGMSYDDGMEATVGWLKLEGDCFWLMDDSVLLPFPDVGPISNPILISGPDNVRIIYSGDEIEAYEYTNKRGKRMYFDPEQVWHHKTWNPYDDENGLGEMASAKNAAESDWLAGNFQRNMNRSNGDQGVYVVSKKGVTDDAQKEQIVAQLRLKQRRNQQGEIHTTFLTDDVEIIDPKIRKPDTAFLEGRFADREEVFIGFGVPASMSSKQESYSIGSASDRFILIEETCMPMG